MVVGRSAECVCVGHGLGVGGLGGWVRWVGCGALAQLVRESSQ